MPGDLRAEPCCTRCKKAGRTECECPIALPLPYGPVDPVCRWPVPMKQREWDNLRAFCDRIPDKLLAGQVRGMVSMMATAWYEVATLRREVARLRASSPAPETTEARLASFSERYRVRGLTCSMLAGPDVDRSCPWHLEWRRTYADGAVSDYREVNGTTFEDVVRQAEEWEAENDRREPEHAAAPSPRLPAQACHCGAMRQGGHRYDGGPCVNELLRAPAPRPEETPE